MPVEIGDLAGTAHVRCFWDLEDATPVALTRFDLPRCVSIIKDIFSGYGITLNPKNRIRLFCGGQRCDAVSCFYDTLCGLNKSSAGYPFPTEFNCVDIVCEKFSGNAGGSSQQKSHYQLLHNLKEVLSNERIGTIILISKDEKLRHKAEKRKQHPKAQTILVYELQYITNSSTTPSTIVPFFVPVPSVKTPFPWATVILNVILFSLAFLFVKMGWNDDEGFT
ncbi:uncharacterized protein LOC129584346 [Paramacrobiotus metropolitanus]|uniref:uncharacterized protein LOC129584346 n=1 Tax=Paramacrobiotus metropolitanus TaxID=2943436 RepID=UPI0024458B40|nr:uncharacterized protein LOC129584346 [Paramacrobiotus metropolitanus]